MATSKKKPKKYELKPCTIFGQMSPIRDEENKITQFMSKPSTIERTRKNTARIVDEWNKIKPQMDKYLQELKAGDETAVYRLVNLNQSFMELPEVKAVINRWKDRNEFSKLYKLIPKEKVGRPKEEDWKIHIYFLIESLRSKSQSVESICDRLESIPAYNRNNVTSRRMKDVYYEVKKRFDNHDPIIVYDDKEPEIVDAEVWEKRKASLPKPPFVKRIPIQIEGREEILEIVVGK